MRDYELETTAHSKSRQLQKAVDQQPEEGIFTPQRGPLAQVTSRVGTAASAKAHAAILNRATVGQQGHAGHSLLQLQRQYGNRYVQRVLALARQGNSEREVTAGLEQAIQRARGDGHVLDSGVRAHMEPAFGADFSNVRVHTDAGADTLNRVLSARAFTTGQDVFFRQGAYNPGSSSGRELLTHELTHVVQQDGDQVQRKLTAGQPGTRYEREADQVARVIMQQGQQAVQREDEEVVRRQDIVPPEEEEEEPVQTKMEGAQVQRQAEAPIEEEEEEERGIQTKLENSWVQRQTFGEEAAI